MLAALVALTACAGGSPSGATASPGAGSASSGTSWAPASSSTQGPAVMALPFPGPVGPTSGGPGAAVGQTPLRLAYDGRGTVWVTAFGNGDVVAVDATSRAVRRTARVGGQPEGVVVAYGSVWVVRQQARRLTRLSPSGRRLGDVRLGLEPRLVAAGAGALWVPDVTDGTLTRIDPTGRRAPRSVAVCVGAQGVAVLGATVWVTCTRTDTVVAVDATSMDVLGTAPPLLDRANVDVAVGRATIWVSSVQEGKVYALPRS